MISRKLLATTALGLSLSTMGAPAVQAQDGANALAGIDTIVVLFEENRSFDNLFGLFPGANTLAAASDTAKTQVDLNGVPYPALPPILDTNHRPPVVDPRFVQTLPNGPWAIETSLVPGAAVPVLGDTTGDLVHRFYQEQVQINNGLMNKFAAVSDAKGLTMSYYNMEGTHIWRYAHDYVLNDNYFHGAFGGSLLNHSWLACACAFTTDSNLAPAAVTTLDPATGLPIVDAQTSADGKYWVNTVYSVYLHPAGKPNGMLVQPQTLPHIGDRLDAKGVSWKWYGEGYGAAAEATARGDYGKVDALFQWHHHPFAYFKDLAYGSAAQAAHLQDKADFIKDIEAGTLPHVVFYKPIGETNMHPGYTNIANADQDLKEIVDRLQASPAYAKMAIFITFDENGGLWDHVAPPKRDMWGPGTRVPLIIVSPLAKTGFVDHTPYDTTSILKTIEARWDLAPLNDIDAKAAPITSFLKASD